MKRLFAVGAISSILGLSCTSDNPIQYEGSILPIVTGLRLTREDTPEEVAVWGKPGYESPNLGRGIQEFTVSNIFPNPAAFTTKFIVALPQSGELKIWAAPAKLLGELEPSSTLGANHVVAASATVISIREPMLLEAGMWEIDWELEDHSGPKFPAGFYRVYFQFNNKVIFRDLFIYSEGNLGPPSLQKLLL